MLEARQVAPEHVTQRAEQRGPHDPAERVVQREDGVPHVRDAGERGCPAPQQRDEPAEEDRLRAVTFEESACPLELRLRETDVAPVAADEGESAPSSDPV